MDQCSEDAMQALLAAVAAGASDVLDRADRLLDRWPGDARLHFLRGSLLIAGGRAIEGHGALSRAVALAPDFALARFQLGLFELTSGEVPRALATWEPLDRLPAGHYLSRFAAGLTCLAQDRFADAVAALTAGIAANTENLPLNHDMRMIVDQCAALMRKEAAADRPGDEPVEASATSFLLGQTGGRDTLH